MMDTKKKKALKAKGYMVGSGHEFLGLSEEEAAHIELKLALSQVPAERQKENKIPQG